jgi:hypothetical protein
MKRFWYDTPECVETGRAIDHRLLLEVDGDGCEEATQDPQPT